MSLLFGAVFFLFSFFIHNTTLILQNFLNFFLSLCQKISAHTLFTPIIVWSLFSFDLMSFKWSLKIKLDSISVYTFTTISMSRWCCFQIFDQKRKENIKQNHSNQINKKWCRSRCIVFLQALTLRCYSFHCFDNSFHFDGSLLSDLHYMLPLFQLKWHIAHNFLYTLF